MTAKLEQRAQETYDAMRQARQRPKRVKLSKTARKTVTVAGEECTREGAPVRLTIRCLPVDAGWFAARLAQAGYELQSVTEENRSWKYNGGSRFSGYSGGNGMVVLSASYIGHHVKMPKGFPTQRPLVSMPKVTQLQGLENDLVAGLSMATGRAPGLLAAVEASHALLDKWIWEPDRKLREK